MAFFTGLTVYNRKERRFTYQTGQVQYITDLVYVIGILYKVKTNTEDVFHDIAITIEVCYRLATRVLHTY